MERHSPVPRPIARGLYRLGASLFLLLGMVGMVLPVMPTTVFLLLSAWCLIRLGDPRADRLLRHPRLGAPLRLFLEQGQVTRRGKLAALAGMSLGAGIIYITAEGQPWLAGSGIGLLALAALYVVSRPEPRPQTVRN